MTDVVNMRRESIDLKALLLSRTYLYTLFHKLFGGTPDAAVVACVLSETTRDVVEEYAGDDPSMKGLGRFLENLGECVDGAVLTEQLYGLSRKQAKQRHRKPAANALPQPVAAHPLKSMQGERQSQCNQQGHCQQPQAVGGNHR